MSKAAVEQLGRALRVELVQHGASASVAYFGFIDTEMVHQGIDDDPLVDEMFEALPKVLHKRLTPAPGRRGGRARDRAAQAADHRAAALDRAVGAARDHRAAVRPQMERDAEVQAVLAKMDAREGEEQPTTA